jgi:hypothetical protein
MSVRISDSIRIGGIRVRISAPVAGKGRVWVSAGKRTPLGWLGVSAPLGGRRRRRG